MDLKKKVSLLLAVLALTATATSCGGSDDSDDDDDWAWAESRKPNDSYVETSGNGTSRDPEDSESKTETSSAVYSKYNVQKIGNFENGIAPFWVKVSSYKSRAGFIDIKGDVLVEPIYAAISNYDYNYMRVTGDNGYCIIDRKGDVKFEANKDGITDIGDVSQGYFWVETMEETLAGNVYTVHYYSAKDLAVVATFEDTQAGYGADVGSSGKATLKRKNERGYYYNEFTFNIANYDTGFIPESDTTSNWTVDVENVEEFQAAEDCWYTISDDTEGAGLVATVQLRSKDYVYYYAIVDSQGNVLMQPQKNIAFPRNSDDVTYVFRKGLCPAQDADSGKWGYIDTQGNWKIQPQYTSVGNFSSDGYATVNDKIVIDTKGKNVLAPAEAKTNLSGKYKKSGGYTTYYLTFTKDGEVTHTESGTGGSLSYTGRYQTQGSTLTISGMGTLYISGIDGDGTYLFELDDNNLYIDGSKWTLCQ